MEKVNIGIIGGSGLYQMPELQNIREQKIETPFGDPSDAFIIGELEGVTVAFLPRHARGHKFLPTEVPYRANIYAMKALGVTHLLSVTAVGSLREELPPLTVVVPDQIIDRRARLHVKPKHLLRMAMLRQADQTSFDRGRATFVGDESACLDALLAQIIAQ